MLVQARWRRKRYEREDQVDPPFHIAGMRQASENDQTLRV